MSVWSKACLQIGASILTTCAVGTAAAQSPIPEREAALQAVFARHVAEETRTLACIAVMEPQSLPGAKSVWAEILDRTAEILERSRFSKATVATLLSNAQAERLMRNPIDPEQVRASCMADRAWEDHLFKFMAYRLVGDVREIVEGHR